VKDADASVLVRFAYTRDAGGNPIAIERESGLGVFYYAYDQLQRLAYEGQFVSAARQYENYYEYDAAGNRSLLRHGETGAEDLTYYDYDAANELTQLHDAAGWTYFAYDANGNTVTEQTPSYTRYFDWDGRGMLIGVRCTDPGWTDNEIRYDGMASRAAMADSTGMTYYAWDGIRVLKTEDGAGALRQRQVHGYAPIASVGDIAMIESAAGDPYAPVPDQVGTNWKLLDSAAAVANSYQYDAFGLGRAANETFSNPYRFAGKPLDPDPALYHFIARQYAPTLGRFSSRDPLSYADGLNVFHYVQGDPAAYTDPLGLYCGECCPPRAPTPNVYGCRLKEAGIAFPYKNPDHWRRAKRLLRDLRIISALDSGASIVRGGAAAAAAGARAVHGALDAFLEWGTEQVISAGFEVAADAAAGGVLHRTGSKYGAVDRFREVSMKNYGISMWVKLEYRSCDPCETGFVARRVFGAPRDSWEWRTHETLWHLCTAGTASALQDTGASLLGAGVYKNLEDAAPNLFACIRSAMRTQGCP